MVNKPSSNLASSETINISCEVMFRHGTLRLNGAVSESLLTLLIQELKR
ncbi:IS66 family insertion sequence element accessory protein TnpB [Salmonella enterica]|nr:IS66 family insertion sequence element accessory protein TnpB [Salmonella enterica]